MKSLREKAKKKLRGNIWVKAEIEAVNKAVKTAYKNRTNNKIEGRRKEKEQGCKNCNVKG